MKNLLIKTVSLSIALVMLCRLSQGAKCFADELPTFLQHKKDGDREYNNWRSLIINNAQNTLFMGGETKTLKMFESDPTGSQLGMAASYSLVTNTYRWAKVYRDSEGKVESITGLALNNAETLLVLAGEVSGTSDKFIILFFLDPATGGKQFDTYKVTTESKLYLQSARSILLAGASRVYVTGRSWSDDKQYPAKTCSGSSCDISTVSDRFQYFIFDYVAGAMVTSRHSVHSSGFGQGTGASLLYVNRATATTNGEESVKILGAHSQLNYDDRWVIGIYDICAISPNTGDLSGLGIKYSNGLYWSDRFKHQFADAFDQSTDQTKLYFTTTSRWQEESFYGHSAHLCIVTYANAPFSGSATANCQKFGSSTTSFNEYFYLAVAFRDNYFNIIYQNRAGLIGYYKTDLSTHVNVNSLAQHHKPWAAVFADGTSYSETKNLPTAGTYTLYRGYFAGQAQQFQSSNYPTGKSHTFGTTNGQETAAALDAVLDMDTCRIFTHTFSSHYADQAVTTAIEIYTSLTTDTSSALPTAVLYKACDLEYEKLQVDDLCSVFPDKQANAEPEISDFTIYRGDTTRYVCPAPQFTLQDTTCDDDVKFLYSIDEKISTNSHFFTLDPLTSKMQIQVLDSSASLSEYEIKFRGVTPFGSKSEIKFKANLVDGLPPSGYTGCPSLSTCATSVDTLTITAAQTILQQTHIVGDSRQYLTVQGMTENGASCQSSDITYSFSVVAGDPTLSTAFISFDPTTRIFNWQTSQVGTYTITVTGSITRDNNRVTSQTSSFVLVVAVSLCAASSDPITLNSAQISDQFYTVGSSTNRTLPVTAFTLSGGTHCTQADIVYTFDNSVAPFISFQSSTVTFDWATLATSAHIGEYTLTLVANIYRTPLSSNVQLSRVFKLTIQMDCEHSTDALAIIKEIDVRSQTYQIYSSAQSVSTPFTVSAGWCQASDMLLTMSVVAAGGQSTEFITFNSTSMLVQWETLDSSKVGDYLITVTAKVTRLAGPIENNHQFSLQVVPIPEDVNTAPVLVKLHALVDKSNQITYKVEELSDQTYLDFGPIKDYDGDSIIVETLYVKSLFTFSNGLLAFDYKALMATRVGSQQITYEVKLTLTDSRAAVTQYTVFFIVPIDENWVDPVQPVDQSANSTTTSAAKAAKAVTKQAEYSFRGVVIGDDVIVNKEAAPPAWKSITTSNTGEVKIYFSEKMIRPSNITSIDGEVLQVDLIPSGAVDLKYLRFTWKVTQFTADYFTIQLVFQNPLYVSCTGKSNYDKIQIKSLYPQYFISTTSFKSIEPEHQIIQTLPPQLSSSKAANEALASVTGAAATSSKTVAIGAFIVNVLMSASLQLLWGMINALQIIGHLPYFNVYIPASAQAFFTAVNELAELKIIPTDEIITWLFQNETDHIFKQMGTLFLVLIVGILLLLVLLVCRSQSERFECAFEITERIRYQIFWNGTLRYFMEGYMALSLNSMVDLVLGLDWSSHFARLTSLFTWVILALVFLVPVFLTIFFRWKFSMFNDPEFFDKFKEIISDLSYRSKYSSYFILIYCYRRLAQICLIVFCQGYPWLQIQLQVVIGMLVVIVFGYISAKRLPRDRRMEYFNEVTIMMCVYHLFVFTDFVDDPITRNQAGYSLIGVTCLNIVGNVGVLLSVTLKMLIFKLKKYCYNRRNKRIINKNLKAKQSNNQEPKHQRGQQPLHDDGQMSSSDSDEQERKSKLRSEQNNGYSFDNELAKISEIGSELENDSSRSLNTGDLLRRTQIGLQSERPPLKQGNFDSQSELLLLEHYELPAPYGVQSPVKQGIDIRQQDEVLRLQDYELPPEALDAKKPLSSKEFDVRIGQLLDDGQRLIDAIQKRHEQESQQFYL